MGGKVVQGLTEILGKTRGIDGETGLGEQWGHPALERSHTEGRGVSLLPRERPPGLWESWNEFGSVDGHTGTSLYIQDTPVLGMGGMRGPVGVPCARGGVSRAPGDREVTPGALPAKPNSRAGFTFLQAAFARALIAGKALQLGNLDGCGCFHSLPLSLSQALSFMLPLSFPQCISHSRSHSCSLILILIFLAVFLAPSPFGGCEHYP